MYRFSFAVLLCAGCLDPNINVDVNIDKGDDTATSSESNGQPSNEPSAQPSNEPSGQPANEPSGQPANEPSAQPANEPSGQPANEPSGQPANEPSGQPANEPSGQPANEPSGQPASEPSSNGGSSSSFTADVCQEWLTCATGSDNPGTWSNEYPTIEQGCFNNHNNVSDPDLIIWFECVAEGTGDCTAVSACGEPIF